ncbi:MAG: exo-alpha-sialidase [Bacteroidales bacterium]|nr:exo-alpha-sialidase [Bacteroidales bacterium]
MKKYILSMVFIIICGLITGAIPFKGENCIIRSEYIYHPGDVAFPSCHASTIIETKTGLLAAWFGGTEEKNPDVGIWISHYKKGSWTKPMEVANGIQHKSKRYPSWNPVLYKYGKEIFLYYKVGPSPSTWWGEMITSKDEGKSWSRPYRLPEDIYGPIKNKPVLLQNGELLCPSSSENDGWRVHMEFTFDNGLTWERTSALNDKETGVIQPTILLHQGGKIQMLCRSKILMVLSSWSGDNGHTWSKLTSTGLPNPNSGIDAVTLKNGRQLLVYNHLTKGRNILNVAVSDDGIDWKAGVLLENDKAGAEFSYPAVIQTRDGLVHITYTWNRKLIKHVVLDPSKIAAKPFLDGEWPEE